MSNARPIKSSDIILTHIHNLQLLIDWQSRDLRYLPNTGNGSEIEIYAAAKSALQKILNITDEQIPLFTKHEIAALSSIPAIVADQQILVQYLQQRAMSMSFERICAVEEVLHDVWFEKDLQWCRSPKEKQERIYTEVKFIHELRYAVNAIPDYPEIKAFIDDLCNDTERTINNSGLYYQKFVSLLNKTNNPGRALAQTLYYLDHVRRELPFEFMRYLDGLKKSMSADKADSTSLEAVNARFALCFSYNFGSDRGNNPPQQEGDESADKQRKKFC